MRSELRVDTAAGPAQLADAVLELYRPDNSNLDQVLRLEGGEDGVHRARLDNLPSGLWRARVQGRLGDKKVAWQTSLHSS